VNLFQNHKLADLASVEQSLATGLDEEFKRPKNLADQLARLLDDDSVVHEDRLRLLIMYILFRNGILNGDIEKLRRHAQLSEIDRDVIYNLQQLGAHIQKGLTHAPPPRQPLFPPQIPTAISGEVEELSLSRFEPAMRWMLEGQCLRTLDSAVFPLVIPGSEDVNGQALSQASLRNASKPTWARTAAKTNEPRQRIIVFMAGGATYAEARACYEVSQTMGKEVFLASSHMLTPKTFLRQVGMLSGSKKHLDHPSNRSKPEVPSWVNEADRAALPQQQQSILRQPAQGRPPDRSAPPTAAMQNIALGPRPMNGTRQSNGPSPAAAPPSSSGSDMKPYEEKDKSTKKKLKGLFKKH